MPEIAIHKFNPSAVQIINKTDYYKIKYNGEHTFLNLLVYIPNIETTIDLDTDRIRMIITDPESSRLLHTLDTRLSYIIPKYRCFSESNGDNIHISFTRNHIVDKFHKRSQTWAYLRFKCIRKITGEYNQVLVYIV